MKLLRRPSGVSRRVLRAPCRCAPRAEEANIFAGTHDPRDAKRVTGLKRVPGFRAMVPAYRGP
eukprot:3674785-Prymnesium_polylepis.1